MLSSCLGPIDPGEFRPDLHLDCPRSGSSPFARKGSSVDAPHSPRHFSHSSG
jgi:hypothetical protein